jgi:hypothetical protein
MLRRKSTRDPRRLARLAWHLSFWAPGLGQLYKRDLLKGAALITASTLLSDKLVGLYPLQGLVACAAPRSPGLLILHLGTLTALWLWCIHDAGVVPGTKSQR